MEMMLTFALFSLIMTTLVLALRSGSITWKNLKSHQRENANVRSAIETIRQDFANTIWVTENPSPLSYSAQGEDSQSILITAASPLDKLRWRMNHEWANIEYRISKDESSEINVVRVVMPFVGRKPVAVEPEEAPLFSGLREVEIGFVTREGEIVGSWEQQDSLPVAVRIRFRFGNGRSLLQSFRIPIGFLNSIGG